MKLAHHIWLTVHAKPEDDEEIIKEKFLKFFPFNLEEEKVKLSVTKTTSVKERIINVLQTHLEKSKHINAFIKNLPNILSKEQITVILNQLESRLDSGNHFFIRFDKSALINKEEYKLTDEGNCYHLKFSIAAFPASRENAIKVIKEILTF